MAIKKRINKALTDLTGYQLQKPAPPKPKPKPKPKPPPAKPKPKPAAKLPKDYDEESREIIRAVRPSVRRNGFRFAECSHASLFTRNNVMI